MLFFNLQVNFFKQTIPIYQAGNLEKIIAIYHYDINYDRCTQLKLFHKRI